MVNSDTLIKYELKRQLHELREIKEKHQQEKMQLNKSAQNLLKSLNDVGYYYEEFKQKQQECMTNLHDFTEKLSASLSMKSSETNKRKKITSTPKSDENGTEIEDPEDKFDKLEAVSPKKKLKTDVVVESAPTSKLDSSGTKDEVYGSETVSSSSKNFKRDSEDKRAVKLKSDANGTERAECDESKNFKKVHNDKRAATSEPNSSDTEDEKDKPEKQLLKKLMRDSVGKRSVKFKSDSSDTDRSQDEKDESKYGILNKLKKNSAVKSKSEKTHTGKAIGIHGKCGTTSISDSSDTDDEKDWLKTEFSKKFKKDSEDKSALKLKSDSSDTDDSRDESDGSSKKLKGDSVVKDAVKPKSDVNGTGKAEFDESKKFKKVQIDKRAPTPESESSDIKDEKDGPEPVSSKKFKRDSIESKIDANGTEKLTVESATKRIRSSLIPEKAAKLLEPEIPSLSVALYFMKEVHKGPPSKLKEAFDNLSKQKRRKYQKIVDENKKKFQESLKSFIEGLTEEEREKLKVLVQKALKDQHDQVSWNRESDSSDESD